MGDQVREALAGLDGAEFDVVVIGAGVNGASAAERLAADGYRVLIVDKGDFASGASSRSSRLLHCGLRYLAPGRSILDFARRPSRLKTALRMARLAMQARSEFVKAFPERVGQMRLHFPIYAGGLYRGWHLDLAFRLLERLGPGDLPLDYRRLTPQEARALPLIGGLRDPDRLLGVAAFREYQFQWPERVAVDAIGRAEDAGARARNHTAARIAGRDGEGWRIELTDMLSQTPPIIVKSRMNLVTAGAWIDEVARGGAPPPPREIIGPQGGPHLLPPPPGCPGPRRP
ncbi:MAG: FAD-dependent oxidoreductase, partial [Methylobacteriaceae bacterium]|nr:FAD-dependent oxidoreductase [Methylobacteriaceae bacterium]